MELLVKECGFTPLEAIQSATQVSAMTVGQGAYRGAIGKGMAADVVVLSADPAADVGNVRKVVEVFKDGKAFRAGPAQSGAPR
jgi:imidazolonepropionase-like amidohydrolase